MRVVIMQPYFFPYIGYFQLMAAADEFVVYDNIEYTKKGWINRNKILDGDKECQITLPIKKDSDYLDVRERCLADTWQVERSKLLNRIRTAYKKAPYFAEVFPVIEKAILYEENNLFKFIFNSLRLVKDYLGIKTPLIVSSTIDISHDLKSEKKVLAICKARNAHEYLNPISGMELYNNNNFKNEGMILEFHKMGEISYKQFKNEFVPLLSIIDVMMFNSREQIGGYLKEFSIVK